jgi:hypothetical protein
VIRLARRLTATLALFSLVILVACSGGVSGPAATTEGAPLAISPTTATVFSDVPVQFVVTGGTAPYFITTSNGTALPVPSAPFNYNTLVLVPGEVGLDTAATLSATDAKNSTTVSSTVTVRPRTVSNVVTVTPTAPCNGSNTSVCPGGDALVRVVLSQNGLPLAGRTVSFTVASGAISIVSSVNGVDTLSNTGTAVTDANGAATIRVQANSSAAAQTALIDVTDVATGYTVRVAVQIGAAANAALNAQPTTIAFQGTAPNTCASGTSADVIVFGGKAPYSISNPGVFTVSPTLVTSNPGRFTVTATGQCSAGTPIAIVDANGASVTVNATNTLSAVQPTPTPAFTVAPITVSLGSCNDVANVALTGGTGNYFAASGSGALLADAGFDNSGNSVGFIRRAPKTDAGGPGPLSVAFSDGQSSRTVTVNLTGTAQGACP